MGGATVRLTGTDSMGHAVSESASTSTTGDYAFDVGPGTYTVTPVVPAANLPTGADEYTPTECDNGTLGSSSCENMALSADQDDVANFTAAYKVTGKVTGLDGQGVHGATVRFVDTGRDENGAAPQCDDERAGADRHQRDGDVAWCAARSGERGGVGQFAERHVVLPSAEHWDGSGLRAGQLE